MGDSIENWRVHPTNPKPNSKNMFAPVRYIFKISNSMHEGKAYHDGTPHKEFLQLYYAFRICDLQILRTGNSCHRRFARKTSSTVVTSDSFVV